MNQKRIQGWLSVAFLGTSLWSGTPVYANDIGKEMEIMPNQPQVSRLGVDLSKDYAVWIVEDDHAITLYDLKDQKETRIVANDSEKKYLQVDGDYIAWVDTRNNSNGDVYMYDIKSKKELRLTDGKAVPSEVSLQDNFVVWTDKRNGSSDIYCYDISKNAEKRISESGKASHPSVSSSYVAWEDERNGNADVYYYSFSKNEESRVSTSKFNQTKPFVSNGKIVYEDDRNDSKDIYMYTISSGKEKRMTDDSDDEESPQLYGDYFTFIEDGDLKLYDQDETDYNTVEDHIDDRIIPSIHGDYVLYAKLDDDKIPRLRLYNIEDDEFIPIGGVSGEPSQPSGSNRYVVYVSEKDKEDSVVLFDTKTKTFTVVTEEGMEPKRPLVSSKYVVWFDEDEEALYSYEIKTGERKKVSSEDDEPIEELYELSGETLLWVNNDNNYQINLTDLSAEDTEEIKYLKKQPLSVDINDQYVVWMTDEGKGLSKIYAYDIGGEEEFTIRRDRVKAANVSLGKDFVVWTEEINREWDLFYYSLELGKALPVLRKSTRDQVRPQASGNLILFEDNKNAEGKDNYFYEMYDIEEGGYSDYYLPDDAEPSDVHLAGNRLVWIDDRDGDPLVYTMAVMDAEEDDDTDTPPSGGDGTYRDYPLIDVLEKGTLGELINGHDLDEIVFVFNPNTSKEVSFKLSNVVFDDKDEFSRLLSTTDFDDIIVRVYN